MKRKAAEAKQPVYSLRAPTVYKNFRAACECYGFPGSHQVGSYGPKGTGIVRTYSNATPGKDVLVKGGAVCMYRLKDEQIRSQFEINIEQKKSVRVFRKIPTGVVDLGDYMVDRFVPAGPGDQIAKFGQWFVKFVRVQLE